MRFILQLMPLLTASPLQGHVISIYAGGFEDGTTAADLPIGCPPPATYGVTGVALISFILLAHFSGAPPNSTYIPAHMENGKFVPGVEK